MPTITFTSLKSYNSGATTCVSKFLCITLLKKNHTPFRKFRNVQLHRTCNFEKSTQCIISIKVHFSFYKFSVFDITTATFRCKLILQYNVDRAVQKPTLIFQNNMHHAPCTIKIMKLMGHISNNGLCALNVLTDTSIPEIIRVFLFS